MKTQLKLTINTWNKAVVVNLSAGSSSYVYKLRFIFNQSVITLELEKVFRGKNRK